METCPRTEGDIIIAHALEILQMRMRYSETVLASPQAVKDYLRLRISALEHEAFICLFLDCQLRLIEAVEIARGTIDQATVYPREVVKAALEHNAAHVIFSHNHPSGRPDPSQADGAVTVRLKEALALVEVRVIDHIIVGARDTFSFAEKGLI